MSKIWIKPSLGLFAGIAAGSSNKDADKANGGLVLGNTTIQLGGLLGAMVGFGEKWGIYTGIDGALALLPFLAFGFLGIPLGIHFKKKWGIGLIIPVWFTTWYIGLAIGVVSFAIATYLANKEKINDIEEINDI